MKDASASKHFTLDIKRSSNAINERRFDGQMHKARQLQNRLCNSIVNLADIKSDDEENGECYKSTYDGTPLYLFLLQSISLFLCGFKQRNYESISRASRNLGTYAGVFAPISLGQYGNLLFLRTGQCVIFILYIIYLYSIVLHIS